MSLILDNLPRLKEIVSQRPFGLITDMDGSISPRPLTFREPSIPAENRRLLSLLVPRCALVAVVSGRQTGGIKKMVRVDGIRYVGHYGMEWETNGEMVIHPDARPYLAPMRTVATGIATLESVNGLIIQDKGLTISIHYHACANPADVRKHILALLKTIPETESLRIIEEKANVGILPPVNIDKGTAVADLIREYGLKRALFIGDDTADVPGFRMIQQARKKSGFDGLTILVTGEETPADLLKEADYTLDGVRETTELLNILYSNIKICSIQRLSK